MSVLQPLCCILANNFLNLGSFCDAELGLAHTKVEGTLPTELGQLVAIEKMWLYSTEISGDVPTELGRLFNLDVLNIQDTNIIGTVPESLCDIETFLFDCSEQLCGCECQCRSVEISPTDPSDDPNPFARPID